MACAACPDHLGCRFEGCRERLAELRVATVVGPARAELLEAARAKLGLLQILPTEDEFAPQLAVLDVEDGDIVVVRTRSKLTATKAADWQDGLERLLRAQGYRDVGVLILDDCAEVTVEKAVRPDTGMAHQLVPASPQSMQGL